MSDLVYGDKVGRDKNAQAGDYNTMMITNADPASPAKVEAAVAELRAFIAQLTRAGVLASDGSVTDPAAVVAAVESQPERLKALGRALAGGAKDAILSVVREGVAALVVALVGRT